MLSVLLTKGIVFMTGLPFPDISPIMFSVGPLAVRWYSMAYLAGIVIGWYLLNRNVAKNSLGLSKQDVEDLIFYLTLGIIVGGRLGYAIFYGGSQMWLEPWHLLEIWKGGMSFHGGVLGVVVAVFIFARRIKYPFLGLTDLIVLYAPLGILFGRVANFINDELWGRVTNVSWAVRFPNGGYLPRHPSQLYEAFFEGLLMLIVLNLLWQIKVVRQRQGTVSAIFVMFYGLFRILMEQFREPDPQLGFFWRYITMGQMLSVPLIMVGSWVLWRNFRPEK